MLSDTLGANWAFSSATVSQGSVQQSGDVVTLNIGTVAVGQTITAQIQATALEPGNSTNSVAITASSSDTNLGNNSAGNTVAVAAAPIIVSGSPLILSGKKNNNITTATFTHAGGVHPASYYVATINWGDGNTSSGTITQSGTTYSVKGSHTYSGNGSHSVTTTVARASGGASGSMIAMALATSSLETTTTSADKPPALKKNSTAPAKEQAFADLAALTSQSAPTSPADATLVAGANEKHDVDSAPAFDLALETSFTAVL